MYFMGIMQSRGKHDEGTVEICFCESEGIPSVEAANPLLP